MSQFLCVFTTGPSVPGRQAGTISVVYKPDDTDRTIAQKAMKHLQYMAHEHRQVACMHVGKDRLFFQWRTYPTSRVPVPNFMLCRSSQFESAIDIGQVPFRTWTYLNGAKHSMVCCETGLVQLDEQARFGPYFDVPLDQMRAKMTVGYYVCSVQWSADVGWTVYMIKTDSIQDERYETTPYIPTRNMQALYKSGYVVQHLACGTQANGQPVCLTVYRRALGTTQLLFKAECEEELYRTIATHAPRFDVTAVVRIQPLAHPKPPLPGNPAKKPRVSVTIP